jgi:hypothetical protein
MTIYRLIHGAEWYSRLPHSPRHTISHGGFARGLAWLPHVPQNWRHLVRTMMHDRPDYRYQSANHVINALAQVSCEPDWTCTVTPGMVTWKRQSKGRRIVVTWRMHAPRKYDWVARSEPIGAGRPRTLAGSSKILGIRRFGAATAGVFR